ncbi:hypothetical protein K503DRAFT_704628, partial [Rhizopogon vinicolor AM-OR11-026]
IILTDISHRFAIRSRRFIDAYRKGLNGMQAAWAIKKYCDHITRREFQYRWHCGTFSHVKSQFELRDPGARGMCS